MIAILSEVCRIEFSGPGFWTALGLAGLWGFFKMLAWYATEDRHRHGRWTPTPSGPKQLNESDKA